MRRTCARILPLLLLGLSTLAPAAYMRPARQPSSRGAGQLYAVRNKDGKTGFIDKTGKLIIGFDRLPAGTYVGRFSEGLAPICFMEANGGGGCQSVGFIDESGKIAIAPRFMHVGSFSEGLAYALTKEEGAGFINHRGEFVIKLKEEGAREFHEGLAAVTTDQGRQWGFIDRTGKPVTKEQYSRVENFSEGLAAVAQGLGDGAKYGFINKEGEVAIPLRFDPELGNHRAIRYLSRFSDGLARVKVGKLYGYIDKKGEFAIKPQFSTAADFSEGLASVRTEDGEWGYIDKSGRMVIDLKDARGESFKEGLAVAAFSIGGRAKYGYIDRTGKVVVEPGFNGASDFVDGVAQVYLEEVVVSASGRQLVNRVGYIDMTGKYIWQPQ
jgi:hypothetical protein